MKNLNKLLLAVVMVMMAFTASAFDIGDFTYEVHDSKPGCVRLLGLSSQGKQKANSSSGIDLDIPGAITYNSTKYRVLAIKADAFAGQQGINSVKIRYGVRYIMDRAFQNTNLSTLVLPSSVDYIWNYAFAGCSKLKTIYYARLKSLTNSATPFDNNGSGITVYVNRSCNSSSIQNSTGWTKTTVTTTSDHLWLYDWQADNCYFTVLGDDDNGASTTRDMAIMACSSSTATSATPSASYNMAWSSSGAATMYFKVTQVYSKAFMGFSNITTINLDNCTYLTSIGSSAFLNCTALTTLKIPASVTQLNSGSFIDGCTSLASVTINSNNTSYSAYNGAVFNKAQTILYRVPEGKSGSFYDSYYPTGVNTISNYAFYNCKKITHIWVPYGVKSIGSSAFYYCTGLTQLKIPSSVTSLSESALSGAKITWCNVNLTTAPTVTNVGSITYLCVPYGATSSYTSAKGWNPSSINPGGQQAFDYETGSIFYTVTSSASTTAVNGATYAGRAKVVCGSKTYAQSSAVTVDIPSSVTISGKGYAVTKIGEDAFNDNTGNITVTGCVNVDTVGDYAFQNQPVIKYPFTHNLSAILSYAFDGAGLTGTVALPYGVHYVRNYAFGHGKYERIIFPASIDGHNGTEVTGTTTLKEFIWNQGWGRAYTGWDFTGVPSNCYFRVPTGYVNDYKQNSKFSSRASYVTAGAYDFAYANDYSGRYFMTILSTASTTFDGTTYDGKAKYVYHPNIAASTMSSYGFCTYYEQDQTVSSDKRKYLITEIGDSCFYGAKFTSGTLPKGLTHIGYNAFRSSSYAENNLVLPDGLTSIGHDAFYDSKIKGEVKVPTSVTKLDGWALCASTLTSIYFPADMNMPTMGSTVWSSSIGTVWVPNSRANSYLTEAKKWGTSHANKLAVYIKPSRSTVTFGSVVPVDMQAAGINAYYASAYDKTNPTKQLTLTRANQAPENTGLLLTDLTDKEYRIPRPSGSVSAPMTNYLVPVSAQINVYTVTGGVGYYWDNATSPYHFKKPTSNWYIGGPSYERTYGSAYLKLSTTEAGNLTDVYTNMWPYTPPVGLPGDYNGDGKVDINDVNMTINMMLGKLPYKAICDMNNDGKIDITDVNLVIQKMLGK